MAKKNEQTLKITNLVIITSKPTTILRKLEKLLRAEANRDWNYDFRIEG